VPIKDIQTFIWAMRTVVNRLPQVQGWVVGPTDEDPEYAAECRNLTERLKLSEKVEFLGFQNVLDILPKVGLVVLSSISEALPLVILEAFAAGIPAVVTDVGACRQLIEGLSEEDAALGAAGRVVRIADPQALADAAIELLTDERRWRAAQRAAIARVETYYTEDRMFAAYREVYESVLG
jgi:glycosyltransferase involved in cell wall biosynthesis